MRALTGVWSYIPLLLPAILKAAKLLTIPKTSCDSIGVTLPCCGSGRWRVRREPDAVTICCSLVPEKEPRIACVMDDGGLIVNEYMNIEEVVAMMDGGCPWARGRDYCASRMPRCGRKGHSVPLSVSVTDMLLARPCSAFVVAGV